MIQFGCWGFLLVLFVVTLIYAIREWQVFIRWMGVAFVVHIMMGVVSILRNDMPMTFMEWLGGGGIVIYGGISLLFDVLMFIIDRVDHAEDRSTTWQDSIEIVQGEVVEDSFSELYETVPYRVPRIPAIARTSRKARWGGKSPFGRVVEMPLSDMKTCENISRPHWHTYIDGKEVCEGE